ncbi:hypothetical protein ACPOL_6473 [Acidisarcina polymorpha]|uniref:Uncharacterized protein n=1 Tax=Acidisarcina polymorpha TaxID=2211140 RepID=A0A2Z5G9K6_9BACT|nr:hypothetical protein ACPOL_6473 [Acidisarcina polymorpha]
MNLDFYAVQFDLTRSGTGMKPCSVTIGKKGVPEISCIL